MTKLEAIAAMEAGQKVRHQYFEKSEWIKTDALGVIVDEKGYTLYDFWLYRTTFDWESNWAIVDAEIPTE